MIWCITYSQTHPSAWLADRRGQQWHVSECFDHLHDEFNHSTMSPNRRHSGCITTYFHRHHNRLWGDETRWMELPGSEETARSILGCRPVEGHHGPLLEPDGTWCAFFPWVASGSCCMGGLFDEETTTLLFVSHPHIQFFLPSYDLRLRWRWFSFVLVNSLWYFNLF